MLNELIKTSFTNIIKVFNYYERMSVVKIEKRYKINISIK